MSYTALVIPPEGDITLVEVDGLPKLNSLVGGYIEMVRFPQRRDHAFTDIGGWVNEDGRRLDLPFNVRPTGLFGTPIVGPVVCWGYDGSLDEADVPEHFVEALEALWTVKR